MALLTLITIFVDNNFIAIEITKYTFNNFHEHAPLTYNPIFFLYLLGYVSRLVIRRTIFAGTPTTTTLFSTDFNTTAFAPTITLFPIQISPKTFAPGPI